jgi:thiazole synthase
MEVTLTINGETRQFDDKLSVQELVRREVGDETESVAVAIEDQVIPQSEWSDTVLRSGDDLEIIRPIQGGDLLNENDADDLEIAGETITNRLIVGTGGYSNLEKMKRAIERSGTELVTVGLRRVDVNDDHPGGLMSLLNELPVNVLPNTAGCFTADDAVKTARLGREALDTNWVKLEVIGDEETLYPDVKELVDAARRLVEDDFVVLPYTSDDPVVAKKLESIGCPVVMPLASPIGSGRGIANPNTLKILCEKIDVPMIVDAGIGSAKDAAEAMELGADGILSSSAIAKAENPSAMAESLRKAVEAGRLSYRAGRIPEKLYAEASTTMEGRIRQ